VRIRVIRRPTRSCIDGIQLNHFAPGFQYEVGNLLGSYLIAEGWAHPVDDASPAVVVPFAELDPDADLDLPPNVQRETYPSYDDGPHIALDRRRRRKKER
jgi:hypothetical protein